MDILRHDYSFLILVAWAWVMIKWPQWPQWYAQFIDRSVTWLAEPYVDKRPTLMDNSPMAFTPTTVRLPITREFYVPSVPNVIHYVPRLAHEDAAINIIDIADLTQDALELIGKAWTKALIQQSINRGGPRPSLPELK